MDYVEMAAFACFFVGGTLLFAASAYKLHGWWGERHVRRSQAAIRQLDDQFYTGLHRSLLLHIEEMRKADRP